MKKNTIKAKFLVELNKRKTDIVQYLKDLNESLAEESKSSAGDKHEVGRAKVQGEIERLSPQLKRVERQIHSVENISDKPIDVVEIGALIETDKALLYLAIDFGVFKTEEGPVMITSLASPLGKKLKGKRKGDTIQIGSLNHSILSIS